MSETRPVLILQLRPEAHIADSEFACILKYGRLPARRAHRMRIETTGIPSSVSLEDYSAIIVGGSPFDISTPDAQKTEIQRKIEQDFHALLEQVVALDFPFLGACSGNGLLGHFLGATISRRYGEAVGCVTVNLTDAGRQDKLLEGFPECFSVLLGHKEACDETPASARLLVSGAQCPVQMFRVGDNVYATQFHPEGDADEFALRIDTYKHHGYFMPDEAEALKAAVAREPTPHAQEILRRFVACYVL